MTRRCYKPCRTSWLRKTLWLPIRRLHCRPAVRHLPSDPIQLAPSSGYIRSESNAHTSVFVSRRFHQTIDLNLPRLLGPRPLFSCGSVHRSSHISPSVPGCFPIRLTARISSSVTPSLLNRPPWQTKYLILPSGERIGALDSGTAGGRDLGSGERVGEMRVAKGRAVNT